MKVSEIHGYDDNGCNGDESWRVPVREDGAKDELDEQKCCI